MCDEQLNIAADRLCAGKEVNDPIVHVVFVGEEEFTLWCRTCGAILDQEIEGARTITRPFVAQFDEAQVHEITEAMSDEDAVAYYMAHPEMTLVKLNMRVLLTMLSQDIDKDLRAAIHSEVQRRVMRKS